MTESSTLTVYQMLRAKLGVTDPAQCCLRMFEKLELVEAKVKELEVKLGAKMTNAEALAKARAARRSNVKVS